MSEKIRSLNLKNLKKLKLSHFMGTLIESLVPSEKYFVVAPPLITHDSSRISVNTVFTHRAIFLPKPYFSGVKIRKL